MRQWRALVHCAYVVASHYSERSPLPPVIDKLLALDTTRDVLLFRYHRQVGYQKQMGYQKRVVYNTIWLPEPNWMWPQYVYHDSDNANNFSEQKYNSSQFCDNYSQRMLLKKLKNWSSRLTGKSWKLDLFYSCWYKDSNNEPFLQKELHEYFVSSERASL